MILSFSSLSPRTSNNNGGFYQFCSLKSNRNSFRVRFSSYPFPNYHRNRTGLCILRARKRTVLRSSIVEEVSMEDDYEEDQNLIDDFDDEGLVVDDEYLQDEFDVENAEPFVGDGEGGGGISLAGTSWDKEALMIAEETCLSFNGDLGLYGFKTLLNSFIRVRIEKLSTKSGSPTMEDIEAFSSAYRERLNEAEVAGSVPENIMLEVSSPGVERVVRVPQDLERFKDRAMYVKYIQEVTETNSSSEQEGILRLVSFDIETSHCTWALADVRVNREKAGKGRPLNKKQRQWRLNTTFDSLILVRIYSEC